MGKDNSTRGANGRFTGSIGRGSTPPEAPVNPHRPDQLEQDPQPHLDAYDIFQTIKPEKIGRGWVETRRWQAQPEEIENMSRRRAKRIASDYETYTPNRISPWDSPLSPQVAGDVSDAETQIHALNAHAHPALKPLARLLLRTESIASSRAEGIQVESVHLARAEALLANGHSPRSEASVEILRNIEAMEVAIDNASQDRPFTLRDLTTIHTALMGNHPEAGVIRTGQNWIGRADSPVHADFVPPPPERVQALLQDLVYAINADALPPVAQAAIVHAQMETIHPFNDGNGRTGRALIQVIWRRRGLTPEYIPPISLIFSRERDEYIRGLSSYRFGDPNEWISYFASAASRSASRARIHLNEVSNIQNEWRNTLRSLPTKLRSDSAVWSIVDELPAHPVISVNSATAAIGKTKPAANGAFAILEEVGILRRTSKGKRNRLWDAPDILDLIARIET